MTVITSLSEARAFVEQFYNGYCERMTVLTGAGISTESGIPDFRSPGGIWSKYRPVEFDDFVNSEESRLADWDRRFEMLDVFQQARPNAAHMALVRLAHAGTLDLLVTQNVDGLHQASGFPEDRLLEIHGNSTYATCLSCGQREELPDHRATVAAGHSPVCGQCGGLLKAAVVSFGQSLNQMHLQRAAEAASACEVFVVLGSSLVVHPAAQLPDVALHCGAELVIINREPTPLDSSASIVIRTPLAETFAEVSEEKTQMP